VSRTSGPADIAEESSRVVQTECAKEKVVLYYSLHGPRDERE
jgi:hypothetical protein